MANEEVIGDGDGSPSWRRHALLCALAGALGWGTLGWIREGHEAMAAGVVLGLAVLSLVGGCVPLRRTTRGAALMALALGFGATLSMEGTLELAFGPEHVGNADALLWGATGIFIKGGLWLAMAGALLGLGLSGRSRADIVIPLLLVIPLWHLGVWLLNHPFDPENGVLPPVYLSAGGYWSSDIGAIQETWGGMLLALAGVLLHSSLRRNALVPLMTLYGFLAGGFGGILGQISSLLRAWYPDLFVTGHLEGQPIGTLLDSLDWAGWGSLSTGAVIGLILGAGIWCNRGRLVREEQGGGLSPGWEWFLFLAYAALILQRELLDLSWLDRFSRHGIHMGLLPAIGLALGRVWGLLFLLPGVVLQSSLKILTGLPPQERILETWLLVLGLPLILSLGIALFLSRRGEGAALALVTSAAIGLYFSDLSRSGGMSGVLLFQCLALAGIGLTVCLHRGQHEPPASSPIRG